MRTIDEVRLVDTLVAAGLNDCEISRLTGIPRGTVRDWRRGRRPDFSRTQPWIPTSDPSFDPRDELAYAYLLGIYLGDGHITPLERTYRLRIACDSAYPGIVAECIAAIESVDSRRASVCPTKSRAVVVNAYSNAWPRLFPQHGPGLKHQRKIELQPWQRSITHRCPQTLLRGLIHSDGCRSTNTIRHPTKTYTYARYLFSNRSDDIRAIFCEHLDLLGIPWRRMNRWNISVARRDGVARLDEFVGPKT
jgi:hypothetical protein